MSAKIDFNNNKFDDLLLLFLIIHNLNHGTTNHTILES